VSQIAVTLLGVVALGISAWVVVRLRETRRTPSGRQSDETTSGRVGQSVRRAAGVMAAAMVAGVLVLGLGGRLMMRLLAATSPESAQGHLTEAEEIVGEVTLSGTLGFVLFIGVFGGIIGGAMFTLLRRWLPERSIAAGSLGAAMGAGLLARPSGLLEPSSPDFAIVSPLWLAVLSALLVVGLFGLLLAVLADHWWATWPAPSRSIKGIASLVPLVPLLLFYIAGAVVAAAIALKTFVGPRLTTPSWVKGADKVGRVAVVVVRRRHPPGAGEAVRGWCLPVSE
jgi:hypothetical protein